jgi:two-component system OmpR family response regulator
MYVLFVEDDSNVAHAYAELAASLGHKADVAYCGGDAMRLSAATPYDAVFMDISLPDVDGRDLCRRVRAAGASRNTCIVAITGMAGLDERQLGDFDGFLAKPVRKDELESVIGAC